MKIALQVYTRSLIRQNHLILNVTQLRNWAVRDSIQTRQYYLLLFFPTRYVSINSNYNDIGFCCFYKYYVSMYIRITMISNAILLINCTTDLYTVSVLAKLINSQEYMYVSSINHTPSHQIVNHSRKVTSVRLWLQVME